MGLDFRLVSILFGDFIVILSSFYVTIKVNCVDDVKYNDEEKMKFPFGFFQNILLV